MMITIPRATLDTLLIDSAYGRIKAGYKLDVGTTYDEIAIVIPNLTDEEAQQLAADLVLYDE
ncbi:MAG: hypothetical protein DWQ49_09730 [Bacteroidetes bacterium]|nr:MAG: hypothetical protein DWQ49_09730 [Bacteroidota bacterium]